MPEIASAFGLFLLRQAFDDVPRELYDAAFVDGFDIDHASKRLHLTTLETDSLPLRTPRAV